MASVLLSLPLADVDGHMDWDWDGGWGVLMVVGMVLFWALIIAGVVWLVRELSSQKRPQAAGPDDDPLRMLDRRLAEGKISPDDYRERRAILSGDQPPPES
jgi:putative membrane protein